MTRTLRLFLAAALAAAFLVPVPARAAEPSRADQWRTRAQTALDRFVAADSGSETAHAYAFAAQTAAWLRGWDDPQARAWLAKLRTLRNPDGGYGLGYPYDFAGDGSTNPASTTYTVTLADHVGPVLLDAWKGGAATFDEVKAIVTLLMSTPRIQSGNSVYGQCVAYSRHANDNQPAYCVHNVNAGVAAFLQAASAAGVGAGGLHKLVVDIARRETYAYLPLTDTGLQAWWRYMDTRSYNDADHNSYQAWSMYSLTYPVGREAAYQHMVTAHSDNSAAPLAHMRLVALPGGPGSMSADGTTTIWCVLGDNWLAEYDAFITTTDARRLAQAAYYAARNARVC